MGNRSSAYPADHLASTRGGASSSSASTGAASRSNSSSGTSNQGHFHRASSTSSSNTSTGYSLPQDQTTCPQCQRVLLIPHNAPLFRCPCGVLFRTETLQQEQGHRRSLFERSGSGLLGHDGLMGRAVICRRCRRVSMLPQTESGDSISLCRCGSPALPLNDMVMSLLAEGELGLLIGGRNEGSLSRREEMEGASKDLIGILPTCKFSAAAARAASARATATATAEESAAPVSNSSVAKGDDVEKRKEREGEKGAEKNDSSAAATATDAAWSTCLPMEGGEGASALPGKGKDSGGNGRCCSSKRELREHSSCSTGGEGGKIATSTEIETPIPKQLDSHNDDLSCRICFEDYVDGDELRVLPCFHRFHAGCSFDWLTRKKTCPLCMTSIDVIMRRPEDLMGGGGGGEG